MSPRSSHKAFNTRPTMASGKSTRKSGHHHDETGEYYEDSHGSSPEDKEDQDMEAKHDHMPDYLYAEVTSALYQNVMADLKTGIMCIKPPTLNAEFPLFIQTLRRFLDKQFKFRILLEPLSANDPPTLHAASRTCASYIQQRLRAGGIWMHRWPNKTHELIQTMKALVPDPYAQASTKGRTCVHSVPHRAGHETMGAYLQRVLEYTAVYGEGLEDSQYGITSVAGAIWFNHRVLFPLETSSIDYLKIRRGWHTFSDAIQWFASQPQFADPPIPGSASTGQNTTSSFSGQGKLGSRHGRRRRKNRHGKADKKGPHPSHQPNSEAKEGENSNNSHNALRNNHSLQTSRPNPRFTELISVTELLSVTELCIASTH